MSNPNRSSPGAMDTSFTISGNPYQQGSNRPPPRPPPRPHQDILPATPRGHHDYRGATPMVVSSASAPYMQYESYGVISQAPPQNAGAANYYQQQQHYFGTPPPPHSPHHHQPPPPPPPQSGSAHTRSGGGGTDHLVQQDIERGCQIEFYSETDPRLLASWASFFRDQFIEAKTELAKAGYDKNAETYRRTAHFVERTETKIIKTKAMKQLFRRHPLTPLNDPIFVDVCYRTIIDYLSRNPPFDGFTFGNPTWRDYMWYKAGLSKAVQDGRNEFLEWYTREIQNLIEVFITREEEVNVDRNRETITSEEFETIVSGVLLEAATSGMQNRGAYNRAKRFYSFLFEQVISTKLSGDDESMAALSTPSTTAQLQGKRVREVIALDEEALILAVLRARLEQTTKGSSPPPQDAPASQNATGHINAMVGELVKLLGSQESQHSMGDVTILTFGAEISINTSPSYEEDNKIHGTPV